MQWFCSFKAYGDLIIACNCLRKADLQKYGILAGSHLRPLLNVIDFDGTTSIIEIGNNVPALFDTKKCGYVNAFRNGLLLRSKIQLSVQQQNDSFVFDSLGMRQRFLTWPYPVGAINMGSDNIYLDYARYLELDDRCNIQSQNSEVKNPGRVYIFPDSRIIHKVLPDWLVIEIAKENSKIGKKTILVKVGIPVPLPQFYSLQIQWVDGFDQLMEQVHKADVLVSADSLPAHLAEYVGTPVFVFSPIPNDYWMPLSCFKKGCFSGFSSLTKYIDWISHF
ncbi:MAG: hypothetical protein JZU65_23535 [Chlorobium sp.]|nr:hypothetical protein [Chlorobium sp.]